MPHFPPMPSWDALHPLIIHFPIALLLLCPLFVLISAILRPAMSRPYMVASLIVLFLGTGSLFIAASTGEEAAELAERGGAMSAVLETHEHLASEAKIAFSILSAILMGIFLLPRFLKPPESPAFFDRTADCVSACLQRGNYVARQNRSRRRPTGA